ncbi:MAG: hypothetical protein ETSY1_46185 (plasmid) [Candidatus Entotheonella factor]|uniref:Uncharacterized protein n=1 Tax=Entotheonella factor TaxID=1429438 RepID=W4M0A4_ENTF1|nr:MAG: hypothetical protein ETSY1_46185 [Candidatus Entotheonella factor]
MHTDNETESLEPWGRLVSGQRGVSASRIAERLGVTPAAVKKAAEPCGVMKMEGRHAFQVYDVGLVDTLPAHPDIQKSRERRAKPNPGIRKAASKRAADTRRERVVDQLAASKPELRFLYEPLVAKLWNPSTEADLAGADLYRELPAMLWEALAPRPERQDEAVELVVDILWAVMKTQTWKVSAWGGGQEPPLVLAIWQGRYSIRAKKGPELYKNVFAAAIRHLWYNEVSGTKYAQRLMALDRLSEISTQCWPAEHGDT